VEPRWHILAAAEIARASDASTWYGGAATVCARLGRACLGARGRVARDGGEPLFTGTLRRTAVDGAIVAATALNHGRLRVAPIVALGTRWTHSELVGVPVALSADDVGLRAEVAATVGWAFARHWSLLAEIAGTAGPTPGGRGNTRPSFFTLAGPFPEDPIPRPPTADLHFALGIELAP